MGDVDSGSVIPEAFIDWKIVRDSQRYDVEYRGTSFLACSPLPEYVISWNEDERDEATRFLRGISFKRCGIDGCGIRMPLGVMDCGNHKFAIMRFYKHGDSEFIRYAYNLKDAQDHCNDPNTRGHDWFDGFRIEE